MSKTDRTDDGDGGFVAIDQNIPQVIYNEFSLYKIARSANPDILPPGPVFTVEPDPVPPREPPLQQLIDLESPERSISSAVTTDGSGVLVIENIPSSFRRHRRLVRR